jgi:uncharacterized protein with NRDE domain
VCTVVLLLRPGHAWPLLLAANRDERLDRPWDEPAPHWPGHPAVVGGRDRLGGGTWMAMRTGTGAMPARAGMIAAVLNRPGSLGPLQGKRSRGELPLFAMEHPTAAAAAEAVAGLNAAEFRTFNMVVADADGGWFIRGAGSGRPELRGLDPGLHIVTAHDPNDPASSRAARHLPHFQAASAPNPAAEDWQSWIRLLQDRAGPRGAAINVPAEGGFGTVASSLAAIGAEGHAVWLFAPGPPDAAPFRPVTLP